MNTKKEYKRGDILGELVFLYDISISEKNRKAMFQCQKCQREFISSVYGVRANHTKSCGCVTTATHGLSKHPLYSIWCGIKERCYSPNIKEYKYYGERGIVICDEWKNDFKAFYDHVIQLPDYDKRGMTLDRINNDGNYEPGNLRWATMYVQNRNRGKSSRNKSGYTGVLKRGKRFQSSIRVDYKMIVLGTYGNISDAVSARNDYIIKNNLEFKIQKHNAYSHAI